MSNDAKCTCGHRDSQHYRSVYSDRESCQASGCGCSKFRPAEEVKSAPENVYDEARKVVDGLWSPHKLGWPEVKTQRNALLTALDAGEKAENELQTIDKALGSFRGRPAIPVCQCGWCGIPTATIEAAREHGAICSKHPANIRAKSAESKRQYWEDLSGEYLKRAEKAETACQQANGVHPDWICEVSKQRDRAEIAEKELRDTIGLVYHIAAALELDPNEDDLRSEIKCILDEKDVLARERDEARKTLDELLVDVWCQFSCPGGHDEVPAADGGIRTDGGLSILEYVAEELLKRGVLERVPPGKDMYRMMNHDRP